MDYLPTAAPEHQQYHSCEQPRRFCTTLNQLSEMLSHPDMFWPVCPEMFDAVAEFDGNPSHLSVVSSLAAAPSPTMTAPPTPAMEHDDDMDSHSLGDDDIMHEAYGFVMTPPTPAAALPSPSVGYVQHTANDEEPFFVKQQRSEQQVTDAPMTKPHVAKAKNQQRQGSSGEGGRSSRGGRHHQCPVCHTRFTRSFNLRTHMLTHNKARVKRFACEVCGKGFDRKHDKHRHISAVHTGKRTYACSGCDANFSRRDALVKHLATTGHHDMP